VRATTSNFPSLKEQLLCTRERKKKGRIKERKDKRKDARKIG